MPTDTNVLPFARPAAQAPATEVAPTPTTPDELKAAIEAMSPDEFDTFDGVVKFANYLLDNKLDIKYFVACVGLPGPNDSTSFTVASSSMDAGEFALSIRMLDRQLDKMIG